MHGFVKKNLISFALTVAMFISAQAQHNKKPVSLKDSLDRKLDLSDYVIEAKVSFLWLQLSQNLHWVVLE